MKPTAKWRSATPGGLQGGKKVSFWRHGEISRNRGAEGFRLEQASACPSPVYFDEFPVGYSLAGCSPAEPASASPTASYFALTDPSRRACAAHESCRSHAGLDVRKISAVQPREMCFFLTSPLIEPAHEIRGGPIFESAVGGENLRVEAFRRFFVGFAREPARRRHNSAPANA